MPTAAREYVVGCGLGHLDDCRALLVALPQELRSWNGEPRRATFGLRILTGPADVLDECLDSAEVARASGGVFPATWLNVTYDAERVTVDERLGGGARCSPSPSSGGPALAERNMAKKLTSKTATKPKAAKGKPAPAQAKSTTVTLEEAMRQLESLGNAGVRAQNAKSGPMGSGAGDNQFGVPRGDVRKLANKIKTNHELALALWKTRNIDAQFLATLLIDVNLLSADAMERIVKSAAWVWVADWLHSYVLKEHADKETLRKKWMESDDRWAARAGWQLTAGRVAKSPEGLDVDALLDRIEKEMGAAASEVQWTMNMCLAEIGIHFPKHRKRAIAIGEKLGIFRDYPCSKGCTSPFAPIWIDAMVKRQG